MRPDGITEITVRSGQAEIYGPQGSENLMPGQTMQVRGTPDAPEFQLVGAIPLDDFDRFNQDRDKLMQQTNSYRPGYVPPDVTGGESLDQYGQWQNDPNYGNVWIPNEPRVGLRIKMASGWMRATTAGPGSARSLGAGRPITMGAGIRVRGAGRGGRARSDPGTSGGRLWWASSDGAPALASA